MIAGLLFANHDVEGISGELAATRPFAGATLIEHQARLLATLGATQLIMIAAQPTPALLGAIGRIARHVTVDRAASAAEAAAALHPLARVLVLGDGLVASETLLAPIRGEGRDLLVAAADDGTGRFERLGGGLVWAGAARVMAERIGDVAALPGDYDPQSTLIRVAAQDGAATATVPIVAAFPLPPGGMDGRQAAMLIAGRLEARPGWFARYVVHPVARLAMRWIAGRPLPATAIVAVVVALGLIGIVAVTGGWPRSGLLLALAACIAAPIGAALLDLRGEEQARAVCAMAGSVIPALAVIALGRITTSIPIALSLVGIAALALRAGAPDRWWSGEAGGYLLIVALAALAGLPVIGLAAAAVYAFATLAARIETMRNFA